MANESDWEAVRSDHGLGGETSSTGLLKMTLMFGSAAVALALIVAPIAQNAKGSGSLGAGTPSLDRMATGSISRTPSTQTYTVRRSVLHSTPSAVCIIRSNGTRTGDC